MTLFSLEELPLELCGADEAGRGCIAGGLFVAGVVLKAPIDGLCDSKKLSRARRFMLQKIIEANSDFCVIESTASEVDKRGLSACIAASLQQIHARLKASRYIFDGNTNFGICAFGTLIKGDNKLAAIAAASILAKCAKDSEMLKLHEHYPQYGFNKHCGYATKAHIAAIKEHGRIDEHRKSFNVRDLDEVNLIL